VTRPNGVGHLTFSQVLSRCHPARGRSRTVGAASFRRHRWRAASPAQRFGYFVGCAVPPCPPPRRRAHGVPSSQEENLSSSANFHSSLSGRLLNGWRVPVRENSPERERPSTARGLPRGPSENLRTARRFQDIVVHCPFRIRFHDARYVVRGIVLCPAFVDAPKAGVK
jgi:hypothetical protein